jgi:hypothetical protein
VTGAASPKPSRKPPAAPVPAKVRCQHMRDDGEQCRGRRHHGSVFCFWHDPERRDDVAAAARKGGAVTSRRRARAVLPKSRAVTLDTADEVRTLLADTITRVRRGQLDTSVANCVGYLAQTGLKIIEVTEFERRLDALEKNLGGGS